MEKFDCAHTACAHSDVPATTGCSCAHDHGHKHTSGGIRGDVFAVVLSVVLAVIAGFVLPKGIAADLLMIAAVLVAGLPVFWQGIQSAGRLSLDESALMTIAVVAAVVIGEIPEGLMVTVLFRIGGILEELAVARSQREVEAITKIIPENANLLRADGSVVTVSAKELVPGSEILVKSGERVPVDSVVLAGRSSVDASSLTGESVPREVEPGDTIFSGMVNVGGVLTCRAQSRFEDSTASKIVEMVKESAARKGNTERLISRFAKVYTPVVIVVAALVALAPPLLGFGEFSEWIGRALVFLVASCPCALVIAIPLSFFGGIGALSKNGILVKGSRYLEVLARAEAVVFDKTGTLTTGNLRVSEIFPAKGQRENEVLRLAAICESQSNHPIARAVVEAFGTPDSSEVRSCEEITSYGMRAQVGAEEILCGSARLMEKYGVDISVLPPANLYVARDGIALGAIAVFDHPRTDAQSSLLELKELGVTRIVMLTGDSADAAEKTAALVGIDEVRAQLLPADKVSSFDAVWQKHKGRVLFVGDGINDSPVLARADAGVAMGMASDAAMEAADVVLLGDALSSLPQAIRIARRTGLLARCNIAFALGVKLLVFVLAFFGIASMWMAVFADVGVTVLTVINATRALRFR